MRRILVVGSNNMDLVIHTPRLPVLGETLTGSGFHTVPGGKGANQAIAAARLGGEVRMVGCVGADLFGKAMRDTLTQSGVDADAVAVSGPASGIAVITVCGGDNHILLDTGANALVTPERVEANRALFEWADVVLLQLEIPLPAVLCAAKLAKDCSTAVLLNPAPMTDLDEELLAATDIFVPNRSEAARMLGMSIDSIPDAARAVRRLLDKGVRQVIITLGADGCVYNRGQSVYRHDCYPVKPVDTTAAGDCFVGALATRLDASGLADEAVTYATAASALTIQREGASSSLPTAAETAAFLAAHAGETRIRAI